MKSFRTYLAVAHGLILIFMAMPAHAQVSESDLSHKKAYDVNRTEWMKGKWGVMTHYLFDWQTRENKLPPTTQQWNKMVDAFDVEGLADQIKSTGASYHILTICQNSNHFCTPSPLYEELFAPTPGQCAQRDLIADVAAAEKKRGIKLIVYSTSHPPGSARKYPAPATGTQPLGEYRNKLQMQNWEKVLAQLSLRWGDSVSGWWLDGDYTPNRTFNYPDAPNFESLAAACRTGNPMAAVAFNRGVMDRPVPFSPFDDFTSGEINSIQTARLWRAEDGRVDGARIHLLSYLGEKWGIGEPRYDDLNEIVIPRTLDVLEVGGAMTWDTPIQPSGHIADVYMTQLKQIGQAVANAPKGDHATLQAARVKAAKEQIKAIDVALKMFEIDMGRYPTTQEGLDFLLRNLTKDPNWKGPYLKQLSHDIFGTAIRYVCPPRHPGSDYELSSAGPDREFATNDDISMKNVSTTAPSDP